MPIASGAAGRVEVGGEASTTWSPDGVKRKPRAANKSCDSYLQRDKSSFSPERVDSGLFVIRTLRRETQIYKELNESKRNKSNVPQVTQDNTEPSNPENEGDTDGSPMTNGGSEGHASEEPSSGERSKRSQMCALL